MPIDLGQLEMAYSQKAHAEKFESSDEDDEPEAGVEKVQKKPWDADNSQIFEQQKAFHLVDSKRT